MLVSPATALQVAAEWIASVGSASAAARTAAYRAEREAKERGARVDGRAALKGSESEEDAPRGALDFFGACRCTSLLKRGSITRAWKSRWFALHDEELQCYNRAPALSPTALHAVDVTKATLRLHEPSGLMSWALENGQLIQLFAATSKVMHAWADVCERGKIRVERGWQPSDLNRKERPTAYAG